MIVLTSDGLGASYVSRRLPADHAWSGSDSILVGLSVASAESA